MHLFISTLLALVVGAVAPARTAAAQPETVGVVSSVIIHAPAGEIFQCFTTAEGIKKAWSVANAKVDFRVGGQIRTSYQPETDLDSPGAIVNTILAFEPGRMLAMKATAPEGSPEWLTSICRDGWSVITLEPLSPDRTRVTCTGMGYDDSELHQKAKSFFQQGNDATLKLMKQKLDRPGGGAEAARVDALFRSRLNSGGGDAHWVAEETRADGSILRAHTVWREVVGGKFVEVEGRIGDGKAMRSHAHFISGIDPVLESVFFHHVMETGSSARGTIQLLNDNSAGGEWVFHSPQGEARWYIAFEFVDSDRYTVRMWNGPRQANEPDIQVRYRRVSELPPGF